MDLKGRTALVTGGAIRVGKAISLALAERGADVAVTYRSSAAPAEATVVELRARGVRAHAARCDQRDPAQVEAAVAEIQAELRRSTCWSTTPRSSTGRRSPGPAWRTGTPTWRSTCGAPGCLQRPPAWQ
jgi:NAD(P)-dependent dehydrogenase (short-subunit alcohol dehydrogenase family)